MTARFGGVVVVALAVSALGACSKSTSPTASHASVAPADRIAAVVDDLASPDPKRSDGAEARLRKLANQGLTTADGIALVRATARTFPEADPPGESRKAALLRAADEWPQPAYVAPLREVFAGLDATAKTAALDLLSDIDSEDAARAFVDLVAQGAASSADFEVRGKGYDGARSPQILFPALLDSAHGPAADGIARMALTHVQKGTVVPEALTAHAGPLLGEYKRLHARIAPLQRAPDAGGAWLADEGYADDRETAEVMLDLFGWMRGAETQRALVEALALTDPRLVAFAALSLVRRGVAVPPSALERAASSYEARRALFEGLESMSRRDLFPARWSTQTALAESVMVGWLVYPTELGHAPDAIELMKVLSEDVGGDDGVMDWYLFRFRSDTGGSKAEGWMAGVAGPFRRSEEPTTSDYGDTFSSFEKWDSKSAEEHIADVRSTIAEWREQRE